jgi:hypothetical protein
VDGSHPATEPGQECNERRTGAQPFDRQSKTTVSSTSTSTVSHAWIWNRVKDIADLIPQSNPDGTGYILKPEFMNVLNKMGLNMEEDEFEKLWAK